VSDTRNEQTSIVDNARDRLARAVARAEAVVGRLAERRAAADKAAVSVDELQSALETARAENKALRARNAAVTKRLEAAIDRLKSVLAGPV
jgi:anti-sigma factor ChrR (cupin superfamily)